MKLTPAERMILSGMTMVSAPGFPFEWLRPQFKAAALRLRARGYLHKKYPDQLRITAAGRAALAQVRP